MKFLPGLLAACVLSFAAGAQIIAVDPSAEGGFESGATFAANGWATATASTNNWYLSSAPTPYAGARCAHITTGSTYTYTTTSARASHLFRDISIPAGSVGISLSFYWKGTGQVGADRLLVYTAPSSFTPLADQPASPSTALTGATLVWTQTATSGTYSLATVSLPSSLAGTTFRLIFTWQNDATLGAQPPAAIDNISVTFNCGTPSPIAGSGVVCVGDAITLTDPSPGGTWSSGNPAVATVSGSGSVSGINPGTATISYTTSCAGPATTVVTVISAPATVMGLTDMCVGSTTTLTDAAAGGYWVSSSPSFASVGSATGVVSAYAPGVVTMSYNNSCGPAAPHTIVIHDIPPPIGPADQVCEGGVFDTVTLFDDSAGYTWSVSPSANASIAVTGPNTALLTGLAAGTAIVSYTSSIGCVRTHLVTINPLPTPITGNTPACVPNSVILSSALPGGSWSSSVIAVGTITTAGAVTALSPGTTMISYTNGCGSSTAIFTVNPIPGAIIGDDTVCVGSTTAFANADIGGTWSSDNTSVATILSGSGFITGISSGLSTITYMMPGGGACYTVTPVYVVNMPGPITGGMTACPGTSTMLSHSTPGGVWSSHNPGAATVSAVGLVTGVHADVADIVYTTPAGCELHAMVTVNPLPAPIYSDSLYCSTDVDTLYDASVGGAWSTMTPGILSIGSSSGIMTTAAISSAATGTVKYTLPTGCAITKSFSVNPVPLPIVGFDPASNTIRTGTGFSGYQWYHTIFGEIAGATKYKTAGVYNGGYYVVVTDSNGCTGTSSVFNYNTAMQVGGVISAADVSIYPNPTTGSIIVDAPVQLSVWIAGADGRNLIAGKSGKSIDVSSLPAGMYLVTLTDENGVKVAVQKLVRQ